MGVTFVHNRWSSDRVREFMQEKKQREAAHGSANRLLYDTPSSKTAPPEVR
jgi:hypothetical protein